MKFDAEEFAVAWLSVAPAAGQDKARPAMHKTIAIEQHVGGVQLVATDATMVLRAWVPFMGRFDRAPLLEELPDTTAVAMDPDGRAKGLLHHALQLCRRADSDGNARPTLTLDLGRMPVDDDDRPTFVGLEAEHAVIEIPEHERLKLRIYEGDYPAWRTVLATFARQPTPGVAISPDALERLAKAASLHTGSVGWQFAGDDQPIAVQILDSYPRVSGCVMPALWDFDTNAPWTPPPLDDPDEEGEISGDGGTDELLDAAEDLVRESGMASLSLLQRRLHVGFVRAGLLMDQLEGRGVVGPSQGSRPRTVVSYDETGAVVPEDGAE